MTPNLVLLCQASMLCMKEKSKHVSATYQARHITYIYNKYQWQSMATHFPTLEKVVIALFAVSPSTRRDLVRLFDGLADHILLFLEKKSEVFETVQ